MLDCTYSWLNRRDQRKLSAFCLLFFQGKIGMSYERHTQTSNFFFTILLGMSCNYLERTVFWNLFWTRICDWFLSPQDIIPDYLSSKKILQTVVVKQDPSFEISVMYSTKIVLCNNIYKEVLTLCSGIVVGKEALALCQKLIFYATWPICIDTAVMLCVCAGIGLSLVNMSAWQNKGKLKTLQMF